MLPQDRAQRIAARAARMQLLMAQQQSMPPPGAQSGSSEGTEHSALQVTSGLHPHPPTEGPLLEPQRWEAQASHGPTKGRQRRSSSALLWPQRVTTGPLCASGVGAL